MDEHLSLMSVHAKPSAPGETDVDAREVGRLVCGRKEDDRGEKGGQEMRVLLRFVLRGGN